jgi:DNA-binding CsgD family transcriptional regulator
VNRIIAVRDRLAITSVSDHAGPLTVRSGGEVAGLAEALYLRMFVVALGGMIIMCALVVLSATVRTENADFARTAALATGFALLAGLALRAPRPIYFAMRRRPALSLTAPVLALLALVTDGVGHSPLSYTAAVSTAYPGFVCGRRWALAAATLIAVGAVTAATLHTGWGALNSVGQGSVAYFVWALVQAGLAESFARLVMRMPQTQTPASSRSPAPVPNLAGDPPVAEPEASRESQPDARPASPAPQASTSECAPSTARLTARQLQVVALLADGLRADEIAQRLGITTSTVYRYVERAKDRTGVASLGELVALAVREGLVPADTAAAHHATRSQHTLRRPKV